MKASRPLPGTLQSESSRPRDTSPRHARPSGSVTRTALALILGAGVAAVWLHLFPGRLPDRTDIVGYPILTNFNVIRYFHVYAAIILVFPLAALASFGTLGFVRGWRRRGLAREPQVPRPRLADEPPQLTTPGPVARVARSTLVGLVLGIELAYAIGDGVQGFWVTVLITAAVYGGLVLVVAKTTADGDKGLFWRRLAVVNAFATPLTVAGLYGVSRASHVTVLADGTIDRYPWMPLALAVAAAIAMLGWVAVRLVRAGEDSVRILQVERDSVTFVAGSVLIFLLVARLPGVFGPMDVFHEGEWLAGARLTESGLFPWRDLYFVHGPLQDVLSALLGMNIFGESRWGAAVGFDLLIRPLGLVGFFLLHARLFRGNWLALAATPAILPPGLDGRFLLFPFTFLLLLGSLRSPRPFKSAVLGGLLFAQAVLTPEISPFILAFGVILAAFEFYYRDPHRTLLSSLPRTLWFAVGAVVSAIAWAGYLVSRGALDDFLRFYLTFARSHELTGGTPIHWESPLFLFAVIAPLASILLLGFFFIVRSRRGRLRLEDWAAAAIALCMAYYYAKFLSRADHAFQVLSLSVPLVAYVVYRFATGMEGAMGDSRRPGWVRKLAALRAVGLAIVLPLVFTTSNKAPRMIQTLPEHFRGTAPEPAWLPSLGYSTAKTLDRAGFEDLREVLRVLPNPSEQIFDFTNQPGIFHYLLGYGASTRYYHVSMAIRRSTQMDLLAELRRNPPGIVVFHAPKGLPGWDGVANAVRHYEISEYLMDHYRPVFIAGGNLLMLRNELDLPAGWPSGLTLNVPPIPQNLYFYTMPCDWGYAPNFLEVDPSPTEVGALDLPIPPGGGQRQLVEFGAPPQFQSYDWLEIRARGGLKPDRFVLSDGSDFVNGGIHFRTLKGAGTRYLVRVGSCLQWQGYSGGRLVLLHDRPQDIVAIRLLRSGPEDGSS